jgi:CubicO group peptidase (beta-lactamase class C family)
MSKHAATAALATLLLATPALAQDKTAEVDKIFSSITADAPGCAAGASKNGNTVVNRYYGLANVETRAPLTASSLFDIGSTQKQFTAASILLLVQDGRLSLSDDIRKFFPELPDYGHKVTVDHLLTHTSGIRDWTGLLPLALEGTDVLTLILRQRGLNFTPGEEWSYSNSGFELAKAIVARVSGMSFAEFTKKRLFEPLGMKSSAYVPDIMQAGTNAALGYQKDGTTWKPFMRLGNNRGGGAIVSTVADLLTWTDALASAKLGKFVTDKLHEVATLSNGRKLKYARGLIVDNTPGGLVISHSGGAAGFSTWMGRVPEHGLSVAVMCNFDPVSATALAGRVADLYLPPAPKTAQSQLVSASGVDVSARAGLFFEERTGDPLRLAVQEGTLRIGNGPPLVAVSANVFRPRRADMFFRSQDEFEMTFTSSDQLEVKSMEGQVTRYRRAQPWTPAAADVQAVDGRYESKELGAVFELVPGESALVMRFEKTPDKAVELMPVARDTWMRSLMIVRLRRDANGKVTGFDYGNPVVRRIAFTRLGDRTAAAATTDQGSAPASSPSAATLKLESLVGEYELAPGRMLGITLENGKLYGQPPNSEKRLLTQASGQTFSVEGSPMTLKFVLDPEDRATMIVMKMNGQERTLPKMK